MTIRKLQAPLTTVSIGQDASLEQVVPLVFYSAFCPWEFHIGFNSTVSWLTAHDKTMSSLYLAALPETGSYLKWTYYFQFDSLLPLLDVSPELVLYFEVISCDMDVWSISKCLTVFHWNTSLAELVWEDRGKIYTCTTSYMHSSDDFSFILTFSLVYFVCQRTNV